jgi:hypothetical protein
MSHKSQLLTLVTRCYVIKLVLSTNTIGEDAIKFVHLQQRTSERRETISE